MPNLTLAIPEELHEKMKKHSEIRWSEVVRKTIASKVETLDAVEAVARKSRLTMKDVNELAHKINKEVFKDFNRR